MSKRVLQLYVFREDSIAISRIQRQHHVGNIVAPLRYAYVQSSIPPDITVAKYDAGVQS